MPKPVVNLPGEIWKPVVGYEGMYEVSNMGRVKSLARHCNRGNGLQCVRTRVLSAATNSSGYPSVHLHGSGPRRGFNVYVLVLEAFVGPRPHGADASHLNDVKTDNRACNLEWASRSDNIRLAFVNGRQPRPTGSANPNSKLVEHDVAAIRARHKNGESMQALADEYGIGRQHVSRIVRNERWRNAADTSTRETLSAACAQARAFLARKEAK